MVYNNTIATKQGKQKMFISEQYGHYFFTMSCEYMDAMAHSGAGLYWIIGHLEVDIHNTTWRDVDLAHIGL